MTPQAAVRPIAAGVWQFDRQRWPQALAQRHRALVACQGAGDWVLLADRAPDLRLLQMAEARLALPLRWQRCAPEQLEAWLGEGERDGRALDGLEPVADGPAEAQQAQVSELSLAALHDSASPAVRLLDALLLDALRDGASDLHLEMRPDGAEARVRLDGVLRPMRRIEGAALAEQIVSRLKVMAELDIGERRLPQDGRFRRRVQQREVDFRLSVLPGSFGEDAVVRMLDRGRLQHEGSALSLGLLGFAAEEQQALLRLARAPHGLVLITGPTGSGKTTTLYAALQESRTGGEKTITIEDPVEYQLPGVVQVPVNDRKGLSFARGLRSILRHDPDRILVGEIRDAETAGIALQAALTGHLVFSTVHANGAFEVIGRLAHMGLDPFDVVSALRGVLAQRLVRRLCPGCSQPLAGDSPQAGQARRAVGCAACRQTGYLGRLVVSELLVLDEPLRDALVRRAPLGELRRLALAAAFRPIRQVAEQRIGQGLTTREEVDRVLGLE